ncbi:hypothetical protein HMP06_1405 [Sphingomonas sp. HMP6]|nr:hypothetical protein HMP06_1405 [Sphingomonas sp. HMP6]
MRVSNPRLCNRIAQAMPPIPEPITMAVWRVITGLVLMGRGCAGMRVAALPPRRRANATIAASNRST